MTVIEQFNVKYDQGTPRGDYISIPNIAIDILKLPESGVYYYLLDLSTIEKASLTDSILSKICRMSLSKVRKSIKRLSLPRIELDGLSFINVKNENCSKNTYSIEIVNIDVANDIWCSNRKASNEVH